MNTPQKSQTATVSQNRPFTFLNKASLFVWDYGTNKQNANWKYKIKHTNTKWDFNLTIALLSYKPVQQTSEKYLKELY